MKYAYILLLFLVTNISNADTYYVLDLTDAEWSVKPKLFYISAVVDERGNKSSDGQALVDNKLVPVKFKNGIEDGLLNYLKAAVSTDNSLIPLVLGIKKFDIRETGTTASHKASIDFEIEFYREINGKKYKLYETKGNPVLSMKGPYPRAHENNISESFKSVFTNFNKWLNENPDLPPMARSSKIVIVPSRTYGSDTILWKSSDKLKWSDFKGRPNGVFMAESNCAFDYRLEPKMNNGILELNLRLNAFFEKSSSWVKNGSETDPLLRHEQLHFDICELNIRKIRQQMLTADLDIVEFDKVLNKIFEEGWNNYQLQQQAYDSETEHGILEKPQQNWENKIGEELKLLND